MPKSFGVTTALGAVQVLRRPPPLALVIAWSASQPHRVGEIAFFSFFQQLYIGRGDVEVDKFAHFIRHRPGEMPAVDLRAGFVSGDGISRRQLRLCCVGDAIEMEVVGRCPTYVNGEKCERASLRPGDTVLLKTELLLLCAKRPMELARPRTERPLHAYGEADEAGIVGEGPAIWELRRDVASAAKIPDHVLVQGESGEDFFARVLLNVRVPPLRERREDIPLLIRHFLRQRAEQFPELGKRFLAKGPDGRLHPKISSRFVDHLLRHPLHRNIRELHGILLRAIEISQGDVLMMPEEVSK